MRPYFDKGDILRVVGEPVTVNGTVLVELLSLKPPGNQGPVPKLFLRVADQEDVDEFGRRARTEEEKETFLRAVRWDD